MGDWNWGNLTDMGKIGQGFANAFGVGEGDPSNPYRNAVSGIGDLSRGFGQQNAGNYQQNQAGLNESIQNLRDLASGKNSVSAEQLRQGMQQGLNAQQSMAAGASAGNSLMASRNAMQNMQRLGYGLSGQQALAGLQERNQAQQALAQLQLGQSGQNLQGALGGYGTASGAFGSALNNPQKTGMSVIGPAIAGMAASDRRLKKETRGADDESKRILDGLKSYTYRYKDEKYGKGKQYGVMAQELEKDLGHVVVDTPAGKMVDGAKAALSSIGLVAALGRRVSALEGTK